MKTPRHLLAIAAVAVLAGCGTEPEDTPVGTWTLEAVGGVALPAEHGVAIWTSGLLEIAGEPSQGLYIMSATGTIAGKLRTDTASGAWERENSTMHFQHLDSTGTYMPDSITTRHRPGFSYLWER